MSIKKPQIPFLQNMFEPGINTSRLRRLNFIAEIAVRLADDPSFLEKNIMER